MRIEHRQQVQIVEHRVPFSAAAWHGKNAMEYPVARNAALSKKGRGASRGVALHSNSCHVESMIRTHPFRMRSITIHPSSIIEVTSPIEVYERQNV